MDTGKNEVNEEKWSGSTRNMERIKEESEDRHRTLEAGPDGTDKCNRGTDRGKEPKIVTIKQEQRVNFSKADEWKEIYFFLETIKDFVEGLHLKTRADQRKVYKIPGVLVGKRNSALSCL